MTGTLYGIGIGPGDPELITLKARRLLENCPVIAYPAPESGESLARSIAAIHIPEGRKEIVIRMPLMGQKFPMTSVYDGAAYDIRRCLDEGQDVAVLCEGDPFTYGSFMYLFERLKNDFNVEIVPGVSSIMASASMIPRPLSARNEILTVIPAPLDEATIKAQLAAADAAVIMKLGRHFEKVRKVLDELDLTDKAICVVHATMADQQVKAITDISPDDVPYFATILVRKNSDSLW